MFIEAPGIFYQNTDSTSEDNQIYFYGTRPGSYCNNRD